MLRSRIFDDGVGAARSRTVDVLAGVATSRRGFLKAGAAAGDDRLVSATAHRLAGLFPQFGASAAGAAATALEQAPADDRAHLVAKLLSEGRAALAELATLADTSKTEPSS